SEALFFADRGHFPWPGERIRARAFHRDVRARYGAHDVVLALDFVEVRSLSHAEIGLDHDPVCIGHDRGEVLIEFGDPYGARSVTRIDLSIVVKQHREIVEALLDAVVAPRPTRIRRPEHLESEAVHVRENVVGSVVIAETWCPDSLTVDLLAILEAKIR